MEVRQIQVSICSSALRLWRWRSTLLEWKLQLAWRRYRLRGWPGLIKRANPEPRVKNQCLSFWRPSKLLSLLWKVSLMKQVSNLQRTRFYGEWGGGGLPMAPPTQRQRSRQLRNCPLQSTLKIKNELPSLLLLVKMLVKNGGKISQERKKIQK